MNYIKKPCAFTGYRGQKLAQCLAKSPCDMGQLRVILREEVLRLHGEDFTEFLCGMALGADTLFAEIVVECKKTYPGTRFTAMIPCYNQDKLWSEKDKRRYHGLLSHADKIVYTSQRDYFDGCMQLRNAKMVDACDMLLSVYDGQRGGTMHTIEYAKRRGKQVVILDPVTMTHVTIIENKTVTRKI